MIEIFKWIIVNLAIYPELPQQITDINLITQMSNVYEMLQTGEFYSNTNKKLA